MVGRGRSRRRFVGQRAAHVARRKSTVSGPAANGAYCFQPLGRRNCIDVGTHRYRLIGKSPAQSMIPAPLPDNELERQQCLDDLEILDTLEEQAYNDLTFLAAQICQAPIALVSLIDRNRQWFKSHLGLSVRETPREMAFCAHAILDDRTLVVEDSLHDERFHDNPLVTGEPHVLFYAGAPLILRSNIRLGTLCVIDHHARTISVEQRQALEAIARQVVSLLELRLQLQARARLDRAKDDFVSMVNHELRTPLTSIRGALSLLQNQVAGTLTPQSLIMVDIANRNSERLLNIVNDILDMSKLEAGKMELHRERAALQPILQKAVELNRAYCESHKTRLDVLPSEGMDALHVMADEQRLVQVMSNLISNAAKFSHADDVIQIAARRSGNFAEISVTDHGPGISPEDQKSLFSKFKQFGHETHTNAPGTGLGLNICKLIVEQHGGTISCDSAPGLTTFRFTIPAVP